MFNTTPVFDSIPKMKHTKLESKKDWESLKILREKLTGRAYDGPEAECWAEAEAATRR